MKLMPTGDNIVIKLPKVEKESKTKAGLILVQNPMSEVKPDKGEVTYVGSGRVLPSGERIIPEVEVGDQVVFNRFAGTEIELEGERFLVLKESDILIILK